MKFIYNPIVTGSFISKIALMQIKQSNQRVSNNCLKKEVVSFKEDINKRQNYKKILVDNKDVENDNNHF